MSRGARLILLLAIALLAAGVFLPVLHLGFIVLDDPSYVVENPNVRRGLTLDGVRWAFTSVGYAANWHPLTWLSHQADVTMFGLAPAGHHLTSLLLHTLNAVLLFHVLALLTGSPWRALFTAALFAVHPLRTESVAWIAERKDLLSAFFVLLTMLLWIRHLRRPHPGRFLAALFTFALALLAKPMAVTLPLVLLILDWWPLGRYRNQVTSPAPPRCLSRSFWGNCRTNVATLVIEKLPLFVLSAGSAVMTMSAQSRGGAVVSIGDHPPSDRVANAAMSLVAYLGDALWPAGLCVWYPWPEGGHRAWAIVLAGAVLAVLTGAAVLLRLRRPSLMAGWCWYLVMLFPVIGVVQVGGQSMADRYTYLSLTGITVGFVWLVPAPRTRRGAGLAVAFAGCALLVLSLAARRQIGRWQDSETLLRHALAAAGESWMVRNALGHTLLRTGRSAAAAEQFAVALALTPDTETFVALGKALADQGNHEGALAQYEIALRRQPDHRLARFDRGTALQALGRTAAAEEAYREALRRGLALPGTFGNLGNILVLREMPEEAADIYRAGIRSFPDSGELWNNLGILEANRGAMAEAVAAFAAAVRLSPEWTTARENLDIARRQLSASPRALSFTDPKNY